MEIALSSVRKHESTLYRTFLIPKGHPLNTRLKEAHDAFMASKPPQGSGGHPWGAPRNVVGAQLIDYCAENLEGDALLLEAAGHVWTNIKEIVKTMRQISQDAAKTNFTPISFLIEHLETRETRDGRRLLRIALQKARIHDSYYKGSKLLGHLPADCMEPMLFSIQTMETSGPAATGPVERELSKALRGGK